MEKSKFSLADTLTLISAVIFGFITFLSYNFISGGDKSQSIMMAFIWTISITACALLAKFLKRANGNFKKVIYFEWLFLLLFLIFGGLSLKKFAHVINVYEEREEIQTKLINNIDNVKRLYPAYDTYVGSRKSNYSEELDNAVSRKTIDATDFHNYGFNDERPTHEQIENFMFVLNAELIPSNYDAENGIKDVNNKWLDESRQVVNNPWSFAFGIQDILQSLENNATKWRNELIGFSTFRMDNENAEDFNYSFNFQNISGNTLAKISSPSIVGIIIGVVLLFLMLLPYLISNRSTKSTVTLCRPKGRNYDDDFNEDIDIKI